MVDDAKALSRSGCYRLWYNGKETGNQLVTSLSAGDLMVGIGGSSLATAMQEKIGGLISLDR